MNSRFFPPVVLADDTDEGQEKKCRRIVLHKAPMEQEIDAHTYKFTEAADMQSPKQANAVSSDTDETLDSSVISRMMEYRDSQLRLLIKGALREEQVYQVDNGQVLVPDFIDNLELSERVNDAALKAVATLMHKYIVWGCLFDWYAQIGSAQARVYGAQLEDIEAEIKSVVFPAGYAKKPMQPFGPAHKMY